jgi:hypothetical protein
MRAAEQDFTLPVDHRIDARELLRALRVQLIHRSVREKFEGQAQSTQSQAEIRVFVGTREARIEGSGPQQGFPR